MLNIHDIKPLVEIPDYTIYIYYGIIILAVLFFCLIGYLIYNYFQNKNDNKYKIYLNHLSNIDFYDTKKSAYDISYYGRYLATTQRQLRLFNELHHNLEDFKYKKTVSTELPQDIKVQYEIFLESLHA
ncbi:MAG: hypothetical protein U9O56_07510 [Campylobacterota bacterium]|nr:hypothetical protein [Campylobacterota bacterium]